MNYIVVTTPENIELKYRLAGAGSRLAAAVVDMAALGVVFALLAVIAFFTLFRGGSDASVLFQLGNFNGWLVAFFIIAYFVIYFGYFIVCELLMNGQSLGKRLFKLRVIRENGMPVGFTQSLIRNLIRYFIDFTGVGVVTIMFSKKCKRLGDMAASTIVVAENPSQIAVQTQALTADDLRGGDESWAEGFDFTEDELYLLKEFRERRDAFPDSGAELEHRFARYFDKKNRRVSEPVDMGSGRLNA